MSDLVGNPEDWFSHEAHLCHVEDCEYIKNEDLYKLEVYLFESETITASRKILC